MNGKTDGSDIVLSTTGNNDFAETLAEEFGYGGIYVDKELNITAITGAYENYTSYTGNITGMNVKDLVHHDLYLAITSAVRSALRDGETIRMQKITVKEEGRVRVLSLVVKSLPGNMLLVIGERQNKEEEGQGSHILSEKVYIARNAQYVQMPKADPKEARTHLKNTIDRLETENTDLKSDNEQLRHQNEELLKKIEELQTLNTERQIKIRELIELNEDLNSYFRSSGTGHILLDSDLRIRKFNAPAILFMGITDSDIGRPVEHIAARCTQYTGLHADVTFVMQKRVIIEKEAAWGNYRSVLIKILPFVNHEGETDGVVITLVNITTAKGLNGIAMAE